MGGIVMATSVRTAVLAICLALSSLVTLGEARAEAVDASAPLRPSVIDEAIIERASSGVWGFIVNAPLEADDATVAAPCPLMTTDEFGWFMGQQGLSPNLNGWAVSVFFEWNAGGAPGIKCGVDTEAHLAQVGQGAPHGAIIEAMVLPSSATFNDVLAIAEGASIIGAGSPEIGGEFGGVCYSGDLAICIAMWHRSGLVLNTVLAGPAGDVTQDRAVSLLSSMIETMVAGLAKQANATGPGGPTTIQAPTTAASPTTAAVLTSTAPTGVTTVPSALDIAGARAGLAAFIASNPVGTNVLTAPGAAVVCPVSSVDGIAQALTALGLTPNTAGFGVVVDESAIAPGLVTVACGGDIEQALFDAMADPRVPHTPVLTMYDITGVATFDQVLADRPGLALLQSDVPGIGGDLFTSPACDIPRGTLCVRLWHREGLVVMTEIAGGFVPDLGAANTELITALVPVVVNDLARFATPAGLR
jgi:hypothetical protein